MFPATVNNAARPAHSPCQQTMGRNYYDKSARAAINHVLATLTENQVTTIREKFNEFNTNCSTPNYTYSQDSAAIGTKWQNLAIRKKAIIDVAGNNTATNQALSLENIGQYAVRYLKFERGLIRNVTDTKDEPLRSMRLEFSKKCGVQTSPRLARHRAHHTEASTTSSQAHTYTHI